MLKRQSLVEPSQQTESHVLPTHSVLPPHAPVLWKMLEKLEEILPCDHEEVSTSLTSHAAATRSSFQQLHVTKVAVEGQEFVGRAEIVACRRTTSSKGIPREKKRYGRVCCTSKYQLLAVSLGRSRIRLKIVGSILLSLLRSTPCTWRDLPTVRPSPWRRQQAVSRESRGRHAVNAPQTATRVPGLADAFWRLLACSLRVKGKAAFGHSTFWAWSRNSRERAFQNEQHIERVVPTAIHIFRLAKVSQFRHHGDLQSESHRLIEGAWHHQEPVRRQESAVGPICHPREHGGRQHSWRE
mmetsp:Transcript_39595/g.104939  ORF Transcript_39595/g.104939 Transcript_39595/m.104939 type:complete len:297 (-) Transcript_39595:971-1861(-)